MAGVVSPAISLCRRRASFTGFCPKFRAQYDIKASARLAIEESALGQSRARHSPPGIELGRRAEFHRNGLSLGGLACIRRYRADHWPACPGRTIPPVFPADRGVSSSRSIAPTSPSTSERTRRSRRISILPFCSASASCTRSCKTVSLHCKLILLATRLPDE